MNSTLAATHCVRLVRSGRIQNSTLNGPPVFHGATLFVIHTRFAGLRTRSVGSTNFTAPLAGWLTIAPGVTPWNTGGPFSVEFWIRPDRTNLTQCVAANVEFISSPAAQRNGWLIYQGNAPALTDGQGFSFRLYNSTGLTALSQANWLGQLAPNAFYTVFGPFAGPNFKLSLNAHWGAR